MAPLLDVVINSLINYALVLWECGSGVKLRNPLFLLDATLVWPRFPASSDHTPDVCHNRRRHRSLRPLLHALQQAASARRLLLLLLLPTATVLLLSTLLLLLLQALLLLPTLLRRRWWGRRLLNVGSSSFFELSSHYSCPPSTRQNLSPCCWNRCYKLCSPLQVFLIYRRYSYVCGTPMSYRGGFASRSSLWHLAPLREVHRDYMQKFTRLHRGWWRLQG